MWATRRQGGGWRTDVWDGARTGVSERLPSAHPAATSARGTDRRVGFVVEGVKQGAQSRVVFRLRWWKEGFMIMIIRNFARLLMRGVFSRVCSGGDLGMSRGVRVMFTTCLVFKQTKFMYWCSVLYVLCYISSLCSGGFADATTFMCWFGVCWGHGTDVPRTGCARLGSATRRVSFYLSLVGGGLPLSGPSSGSSGSVRVYRRVIFGKKNRVGWTSIGSLSDVWVGGRLDDVSCSDWGEHLRINFEWE